ncbi:aldose 1-epimerase family protein [Lacihabitans sp. LS3-19]|uniref:aldose 1-epimerase family protein n=1 Tax=Lacihabitans sp. LS3-19 TaxID=2487335 RepID=UPI0020CD4A33|nr:aldose 1-epimerase family protein [Lacihabitans sp. LS3-19]MCP9766939.1 aldose 1-epimerase family protein [Lacihabitans sp. LS3-19]
MVILENENILVEINPLGAELKSLYSKKHKQEFIWEADPKFWGKSSPVLFPIVGALKNDSFEYQGNTYNLPRHGFARTMTFEIEKLEKDSAVFLLKETQETLSVFPFRFELRLEYYLFEDKLKLNYKVLNPSKNELYFSIGGHPAFKCPINSELNYEDYSLSFEKEEDFEIWPINTEGLTKNKPEKLTKSASRLDLNYELFHKDALVFKDLKSESIKIQSDKSKIALEFSFKNFPFFGIWAAKNADFVCLEPWYGIADAEDHNKDLSQKEGIIRLSENETFENSFEMKILDK